MAGINVCGAMVVTVFNVNIVSTMLLVILLQSCGNLSCFLAWRKTVLTGQSIF